MNVLPGTFSVCRLPPSDRVPSWALELHEGLVSITRTPDELSIVCPDEAVPPDVTVEDGFKALQVPGPIPFAQTGVLAAIATPLAAAGISIFALSTYDTDYVLVRAADLEDALAALQPPAIRTLFASGSPYEPVIGFSRAVRHGDRVLVSGTGPVMPDGGCPESTLEQARRCWEIVLDALAEAGASAADVIRTRTFLTPQADADGAMQAHGEVFADVRPASTMLAVHSLLDPRWTVEVEAEADVTSPGGRRPSRGSS
jgi:enamine deaminase RidA (YjgF/YER057c/UK114 family)